MAASIQTLGDLRKQSGTRLRPVKQEMRDNLVRKLQAGETLFPGIIGYDETVIPQLVNAILSRHNFILLGLRGQAKSRILRGLVDLLDEQIPVVPGCEIHDNPLAPLCAACRARIATEGDSLPIAWLPREARFVEKLATPDVTIADMVGDIDPIKAAQAGLNLSDELTMHYGLLPRANRGIFAINELPDLAGKIQVGLFNILQEGDVQIKGYPIRLKLDVMLVFTANPEDYTARGKIITPLKDRIGSEIRTHYPATRQHAMAITRQEAWTDRPGGLKVEIPDYVREVVEEVAFQARADRKIDKRSGVSQRLPITTLELVVSNAERRALQNGETLVVPRVTDLYAALPSITGKFELEYEGELRGAEQIARDLIRSAVGSVFTGMFDGVDTRTVIEWFDLGGSLPLSDATSADEVIALTGGVQGLRELADGAGVPPGAPAPAVASAIDFVLEGLYAQKKISRSDERGYAANEAAPAASVAARRVGARRRDPDADGEEEVLQLGLETRGWSCGLSQPASSPSLHRFMKYRYTKFTGDELDDLDLEDLVAKLSDLLLSSGFGNPYGMDDAERTMQALHDAILDALFNGGVLPEETIERLLGDPADGDQADARSKLEELIQQIIERMTEEGYITTPPDLEAERERRQGRGGGGPDTPQATKFEVTDKTLDFLGYRALRDLLGSLGKSSYGRHDTREQATGVETTGAPKPYEFGDTLNLDAASTLLNAVQREARDARERAQHEPSAFSASSEHPGTPAGRCAGASHVTHEDLMVVQGEYQSSCATVLMLDCSHSMILYGEDRFTPAKRVALALAQLIKTQYPGRRAESRAVPRFGRGDSARRARARARRPLLHEHARRTAAGAPHSRSPAQGHAADHHDHRRQAVGAHAARRPHLQERLRPRPVHRRRDVRRSRRLPQERHHDQHVHARARLRPGELRPAGGRDLQGQGVLHDAVHARSVRPDGLHGQEDEDDSLKRSDR